MNNIAIFASGNGSNASNIIQYFAGNDKINIPLIVTDNPCAGVINRADKADTKCVIINKEQKNCGEFLVGLMKDHGIDFIVLAGYLSLLPPSFTSYYTDRIVNIHPALLPRYGGKGMYGDNVHKAVIAAGEKKSGITIHYVNENYDEGAIIYQQEVMVEPHDTPETLASKIHELEYRYFPEVIARLLEI